jgi:hypothetical protein
MYAEGGIRASEANKEGRFPKRPNHRRFGNCPGLRRYQRDAAGLLFAVACWNNPRSFHHQDDGSFGRARAMHGTFGNNDTFAWS